MLSHLQEKIIENYPSNQKIRKGMPSFVGKKVIILITLYKPTYLLMNKRSSCVEKSD